jgi:hypothetical protein
MKLKKISLPLISVLLGTLLSVILLEVIFRLLPVQDSLMTLPVNSTNTVLRFKEDRDVIWSSGYNFSIVTKKHINNYGFFNDQNYTRNDESPLLAIIGDSYVEALQVENKNSMHGILSQNVVGKGRVYSFASSGSPLSNYLAYAHYGTSEFKARALVFVIVGNDFDESLKKYKNAPGFHYFSDSTEGLELVRIDYQPTFIKRVVRQSALARYLFLNMQLNWGSIENFLIDDVVHAEENFVGNTRADFDQEHLWDSKKVVDAFFEELPIQTGLEKDKILFVLDGMRPHLYDPFVLTKAKGSYFDLMRK